MELRHLRYFKAVAELLNFSRAAERLRVGQPALSRQIRNLEHELGTRLLDRNHVRVQLTDAGRTYYAHTCKILAQVDIAVASAQETMTGASGELVIYNDWRLSNRFVLGAIADFRARYPRVEVTLRDLQVHEQLTMLRTRKAHLAFLIGREFSTSEGLESLSILTSDMIVTVGDRHRLAAAKNVRIADLAGETWIITGQQEAPGLREFITQICRLSGFNPIFTRPTQTIEGVLARVATGYGVCLLPEFLVASLPANPFVRCLRSDCAPFEMRAAWHRSEDSKLLQQFLAILRHNIGADAQPQLTLALRQVNPTSQPKHGEDQRANRS